MQTWLVAAILTVGLIGAPAVAESTAQTPLTLERVFASPGLGGPAPRAVRLSPDGQWVTSLRPRLEDRERFDLWAMPADGGPWRMLVDSTRLGTTGALSEAEKMQRERARIAGTKGIVAYDWAPDSQTILVPVDGDLFLADLQGGVTRLTASGAGALDAVVSPKGGYVSFVRNQNLVVIDRATGKELALTTDGAGPLSWALAEFVAQEEMHRSRGLWWSPDDRRMAVQRTDESGVAIVSRAAIGADGTEVYQQRYPVAGSANASVDLWIMNPAGGSRIKVDLGRNRDIYLARVDWSADGSALYVQRQSRDQKRLDVLKVNPETGASTLLFSEESDKWLNLHDSLRTLKDGGLLWQSARDGFDHLYRFEDGQWVQLTQGPWMVRRVTGVDEAKGIVYFLANKDTPLEQHLYSVPIRGGEITRLTSPGMWHAASMDKSGHRAIIEASSQSQPPQVWLADNDGNRIAWIEQNQVKDGHPYAPFAASHVAPRFETITAADGSVLHIKLLTPKREPGKRYPVLVQVYNGPGAGRQVMNQWGGALHQYLVDQGWIIFSVDGRGSPIAARPLKARFTGRWVEWKSQTSWLAWIG